MDIREASSSLLAKVDGQILPDRPDRMVIKYRVLCAALGLASGRVIASIVYQASAFDPVVIVAVALTMSGIGLLSAFGPARRALATMPAMLLREE